MPSYLRPARTIRAIDCILKQDFEGFEAFIIGDKCPVIQQLLDSGKAAEYAKIAENKGNKLTIINLPIHYGGFGYKARNHCVRNLATAEYVMFLDNDDVIKDNHISNYFSAISGTEYGLMYFDSIIHPIEVRGEYGKWIRHTALEKGKVGHAEIIVKRNVAKFAYQNAEYGHDWHYIRDCLILCKSEKSSNPPTYIVMGVGELRENID